MNNIAFTNKLKSKIFENIKEDINTSFLLQELTPLGPKIAGGFIRDSILNRPIKDIDIFLNAHLENIYGILEQLNGKGKIYNGPFGSPRWKPFGPGYDIDIVPFSNFIVRRKKYQEMEEVLKDFDITINAIALDYNSSRLIDPLNGISDIQKKIIRATNLDFPDFSITCSGVTLSSLTIFWFRLLHFKELLGFEFSESTFNWVYENRFRFGEVRRFESVFFKPLIPKEMLKIMGGNE